MTPAARYDAAMDRIYDKGDAMNTTEHSADTNKYPTAPGWYCIVFLLDGDERDYGPIYQFEDGGWFDESGDQIESFYDPLLGIRVSVESADDYVRQ